MRAGVDFLTNMATAWMVASIITPLFGGGFARQTEVIISGVIISLIFLTFAILLEVKYDQPKRHSRL